MADFKAVIGRAMSKIYDMIPDLTSTDDLLLAAKATTTLNDQVDEADSYWDDVVGAFVPVMPELVIDVEDIESLETLTFDMFDAIDAKVAETETAEDLMLLANCVGKNTQTYYHWILVNEPDDTAARLDGLRVRRNTSLDLLVERLDSRLSTYQSFEDMVLATTTIDRVYRAHMDVTSYQKLLNMIAVLERNLAEDKQDLEADKQELAQSKQTVIETQRELEETKQTLEEMRQSLEENRLALEANEQALADDRRDLTATNRNVTANDRELTEVRRDLLENQQAIKANEQALEETNQALATVRQSADANRRNIAGHQTAIAINRRDIAADVQALADFKAATGQDLNSLTQQVAALRNDMVNRMATMSSDFEQEQQIQDDNFHQQMVSMREYLDNEAAAIRREIASTESALNNSMSTMEQELKDDIAALDTKVTRNANRRLPMDGSGAMSDRLHFNVGGNGIRRILSVGDRNVVGGKKGYAGIMRYNGQNSLLMHSDSSVSLYAGESPVDNLLKPLGHAEVDSSSEQVLIGADNSVRIVTNLQNGYNGNGKNFYFLNNGDFYAQRDLYANGGLSRVYHTGFRPYYISPNAADDDQGEDGDMWIQYE